MTYLFNSKGNHVANLVGEQLHAPTGKNIGHYKPDVGILIDMSGRYLGEIIHGDRLMYNLSSPYKSTNYEIMETMEALEITVIQGTMEASASRGAIGMCPPIGSEVTEPINATRGLAILAETQPVLFLRHAKAAERFYDFFTANIANKNTRRAY